MNLLFCFRYLGFDKDKTQFPYFQKIYINPLNVNPTKWSDKLKQFVGSLSTNCLSVFDHFVGLTLKVLRLKSLTLLKLIPSLFSGFFPVFFKTLILESNRELMFVSVRPVEVRMLDIVISLRYRYWLS